MAPFSAMSRGFSQSVIDAINSADPRHIGVVLGKLMIEARMSTAEAAEVLRISRNSVHLIIRGQQWPRQETAARIEQLIDRLKNQH